MSENLIEIRDLAVEFVTGEKVHRVVEGVSFVQTFRNQFDTPLKQKSIAQVAADIKAGKLQADAATN